MSDNDKRGTKEELAENGLDMKQHNMLSSPKQDKILSNATQKAKTILGKSDNKTISGSQQEKPFKDNYQHKQIQIPNKKLKTTSLTIETNNCPHLEMCGQKFVSSVRRDCCQTEQTSPIADVDLYPHIRM